MKKNLKKIEAEREQHLHEMYQEIFEMLKMERGCGDSYYYSNVPPIGIPAGYYAPYTFGAVQQVNEEDQIKVVPSGYKAIWRYISAYATLTLEDLRTPWIQKYLDWDIISLKQDLSDYDIIEFSSLLKWNKLSERKLSEEIIKRFFNKFTENSPHTFANILFNNLDLSEELILKIWTRDANIRSTLITKMFSYKYNSHGKEPNFNRTIFERYVKYFDNKDFNTMLKENSYIPGDILIKYNDSFSSTGLVKYFQQVDMSVFSKYEKDFGEGLFWFYKAQQTCNPDYEYICDMMMSDKKLKKKKWSSDFQLLIKLDE